MSTWKIYTSTTEALMNETANYKNGEIKTASRGAINYDLVLLHRI